MMKTVRFHVYLTMCAMIAFSMLGGLAVVNWFVDPAWAYTADVGDRFAPYREQTRRGKAEIVRRGRWDGLFFGTSRVETGINPRHASQGDRNIFNAALPACNMIETGFMFQHAVATQGHNLQVAFVGIDFQQFTSKRFTEMDFNRSRLNSKLSMLDYHCENLLSLDPARMVLSRYAKSNKSPLTEFGQRRDRGPIDHEQQFDFILTNSYVKDELYAGYAYAADRVAAVKTIIDACREKQIRLVLFINPVHAWLLETMDRRALWPVYEGWKRDMTRLADDGQRQGGDVVLWDFSGYSPYTTEPVPPGGRRDRNMRWFWEASHYKTALGDEIQKRINNHPDADPEFGRLLTPANLEAHLEKMRADHDRYARENPIAMQHLDALFARIADLDERSHSKRPTLNPALP